MKSYFGSSDGSLVYFAAFVGLLLVLTAEARVGNSSESLFCTETKECLLYDVVCQNGDYEVRHYDSVKWVSTVEKSMVMEMGQMMAFRRLFKYITGANADGAKIEMTCPVTIKVEKGASFWESNTYTMSFVLPSNFQTAPPKPTDEKVYIHESTHMKAYVRSYGGWMMGIRDKMQAESLANELDSVQASYVKEYHYAVGYDSPMKMWNRHNEVWYVAAGEPVCSSP
ncbi:heme-binding protein 2 [Aplochiton taeniatus]